MAYALITDLDHLGASALWLADLSSTTKQAAIDHASAYIDSFLAKKYAVPLVSWGADVRGCACKIAVWYLLVNKGFNPSSFPDKSILVAYEQMIEWLKMQADGTISLAGIEESTTTSVASTEQGLILSDEQRGY